MIDVRQQMFVRALATYLVGDQASMSIRLQMGDPNARTWSRLRTHTPLFGYPSEEEAVELLSDWLGIDMTEPKSKKKSKKK